MTTYALPSQKSCFVSTLADLLEDTVTLRNPGTPTRGSGGGVVAGTPADTTGVSAGLEPLGFQTGDVREIANRLQLKNPYVWVFAADQAHLTEDTKIIFGSRTFLVRSVMELGSDALEKRAICDEV